MAARSKAKGNLFAGIVLDQPTYRGYMYKQSHTHKSFNKRFLILYPKILIYYDTEQDYLRDLERKTLEVSDHHIHCSLAVGSWLMHAWLHFTHTRWHIQ